jgi:predicted secreted protein
MAAKHALHAFALLPLLVHSAAAEPPSAEPASPVATPTVLHLTQSAERRIARDVLHVELKAEKSAADPQTVQAAINQSMAKALAEARRVPGIEIETGAYSVYRAVPQKGPPEWTGSQSLLLLGTDAGALLKLAGNLQSDGLVMANLAYEASAKAVRGAEDDLTAEALSALERRAAAVAQQLRLSVLGFRDLTIGNSQSGGSPVPRLSAMGAAMPPPVAASGEATIRLTVSADVLLAAKQP